MSEYTPIKCSFCGKSEYEVKTMTAYEVSVSKLAAFDSAEEFDLDREFSLYTGAHAAFGEEPHERL